MRIKINGSLKSSEQVYLFESIGELNNGVISFYDKDVSVRLDLNNNEMIRTTHDYELRFLFLKGKKTNNSLILKDIDQTINMDLYTIDIIKKDGYFYTDYELNNDELFELEINYEGEDNE